MANHPKLMLWKRYYLDASNPQTFMNATASAKAAGYRCGKENGFQSVGSQNLSKLKPEVDKWLIEHGLTEDVIKFKIIEGLGASETQFFQKDGVVTDERECIAWGARLGYTKLAAQVLGMITHNVNMGVHDLRGMSDEELDAAEKALEAGDE